MIGDVLTIDRQRFRLELWQRREGTGFDRRFKFPIAVGRIGNATPRGVYMVDGKSRTPDWMVPDSEWAIARGLKPGDIYKFDDPVNPFAVGFISVSGGEGIGIHGTKFDPEIGTRASAGCVRMRKSDIRKLWDHVPVGMTVVIL